MISVITPVVDHWRGLDRAAASVRSAGSLAEHIIVDARNVALRRQDPLRIRDAVVISSPGHSEPACMNTGLQAAHGRFVTWLDPWAWYEVGGLETLAAGADDADVIVGRAKYVGEGGQVIFESSPPIPITLADLCRVRSRWYQGRSLVRAAALARIEMVRAAGGYASDNAYAADHALWLALCDRSARFRVVDAHVLSLEPRPDAVENNVEMLLAMARSARRAAAARPDLLGSEGPTVAAELDAVERKAGVTDAVLARWRTDERDAATVPDSALTKYREALAKMRSGRTVCELGLPYAREAVVKALACAPRWREIRIVVIAGGETVLPICVRESSRVRRVRTHLLTLTRSAAESARARFRAGTPWSPLHISALADATSADDPIDILMTDQFLLRVQSPVEMLRPYMQRLRIGGAWAQVNEPVAPDNLDAYVSRLQWWLRARASFERAVILDVEADASLFNAAEEEAMARTILPGVSGGAMWARDVPGRKGLNIDEIGARFGLSRQWSRRFGEGWHHPMTPWRLVESMGAPEHGWVTSVWRRGAPA